MMTEQPIYGIGERVDGLYDENTDGMWYPGRIQCVHPGEDGFMFEVLYDDGEVEMHVRSEFLRKHVPGTICVGTRVLCRYDGGDEYYTGQVSDVQENGRYTIAYDDGEVEEDVPLDHIVEPEENEEEVEPSKAMNDVEPAQALQGGDEDVEAQVRPTDSDVDEAEAHSDPINDPGSAVDAPGKTHENDYTGSDADNHAEAPMTDQPVENFFQPIAEQPFLKQPREAYADADESPLPGHQQDEQTDSMTPKDSAETAYILESLQLLEKRLGDATSTKSVLSTLVKQMRAYPQITADLVHERGGERLIIDALKFHQSHAVIQCYGCVLLRRLCFLCVKSTQYLLRNGIVELVLQAMKSFAEDAILQASACGALAVFTRIRTGLNILIEYQVAHLVLSTLIYHKTYSVHTRQVHYYACEVLLELCELDDLQTLNLLCGEQEEEFTSEMSPISLLLFLLRQGLSLDDKKACCAVGSLLMCLAASGRRAAALILGLNGLAELSTVMARYPTEPSIQKYSAAASKQIALCSVRQSPTKRIKETATEILREADSIECTPTDRPIPKKNMSRGRSMKTGKRKNNLSTGYGAPSYSRGTAYSASTPYRDSQGYSKATSPYRQTPQGFDTDRSTFGYPARDFPVSAGASQQPSNLVILEGGLGMESFESGNKRRGQPSKEDRHSELFDAYGIHGISNSSNGRPYGTKRAQLRAHLASAESAWVTPGQYLSRDEMLSGPSTRKPHSSRSDHHDQGLRYSDREFMPGRQNRWDYDEGQNIYDPEYQQPRGAKRKKKTPLGQRTAFQVRIENENQLRVSKEQQSPFSPHQRLGAATKRAAKARHKRIAAGAHTPLTGRMNDASSESLNEYATHLFQDNAGRAGMGVPSTRLTPREKEEIRERERLSFAEKLHKMIDKAKSSLANGNVTSISDAPRPKRSAATTKPHRQPGATGKTPRSSDSSTLPQSHKKSRATPTNTSKRATKDLSSPRETPEARAVKPSSVMPRPKVAPNDVGAQRASSVHEPRAKTNAARPAAAPKATTDKQVQNAAKPNKVPNAVADTQSVDVKSNQEAENLKEPAVEVTPVEASVDTVVADMPQQVTHTEEISVILPVQSTVQLHVPSEVPTTNQAEEAKPEVLSNSEANHVPDASAGSMPEAEKIELSSDHMIDLPYKKNAEEVLGKEAGEEAIVEVRPSVEADATAEPELPLSVTEQDPISVNITDASADVEGEAPKPAADLELLAMPTEESNAVHDDSGSNAMVDAMYGDDYNEFEDNGGDDEDMTSDTEVDIPGTATEAVDPVTDGTLPVSKSGEDLYGNDDNEFEEEDLPNTGETEAEDVPVSTDEEPAASSSFIDAQGEEGLGVADNDPVTGNPDSLDHVNMPESEAPSDNNGSSEVKEDESGAAALENASVPLEAEGDTPSTAVEENTLIPTAEPKEADKDLPQDSSTPADDGTGSVDVCVPDGDTEEAEKPQEPGSSSTNPFEVDVVLNDPDAPASSTKEESNESAILNSDSSPDPYEEGGFDDDVHGDTPDVVTNEDTDAAPVSKGAAEVSGDHGAADAPKQPTEPASEVEVTSEPDKTAMESDAILPAALENGIVQIDIQPSNDKAVDTSPGETAADSSHQQSDERSPMDTAEVSAHPEDDADTRKLISDNSNVSVQSAGYDEENFEDDEGQQDIKAIEPAIAATEDATEVVNHQEPQSTDTLDNSAVSDIPETKNDVPAPLDGEDAEAKTLAANGSEFGIHSESYEDDDFDKGAQEVEKAAVESFPDEIAQTPDQQGSHGTDIEADTISPSDSAPVDTLIALIGEIEEGTKDAAIEKGGPSDLTDQDNDLGTGMQEDAPNEAPMDDSGPATEVDQPSEQHQLDPIDPVEAEISVETVSSAADIDATNEVDQVKDSPQSTEHDAVAVDRTGNPIETSELRPRTPDNPTCSIATSDIPGPSNSAAVSTDVDSPGTIAQPATYDGDDFDDSPEQEEVPADATAPGLGGENEDATNVSDTEPISKNNNDEVSAVSAPGLSREDDDPAQSTTAPEFEPQSTSEPEKTGDEVTPTHSIEEDDPSASVDTDDEFVPVVLALDPKELSSTPSEHCAEEISPVVLVDEPGLDSAVDTTVSEVVAPETESTAAGTSEGADTQAPSVSLEDEGYKADASVLEATATNPAIPPSIQKEESNGPADATPRDEPDPSSVLEPTAALMPEQASLVEDADTQSAETSPTDESGHDLAAPADAPAAGQMNDYSQGEDDFDEDVSEPEPKSTNVDVVAEIPMEPAVNATNDESQYDDDDADADFDGDEDTTITSNEIPAKDAPIVQPEENDVSTVKDTTTPEHTTMEEYATYLPTSTWENGTGTLGDETPANEIDNKALVIENPEPNTTPESVAVTPEPSPSTNAYEEDFPVDDAPPITNGQLDTTKAVDPANNTLGEVEQAVSSAAKAEDMLPETNPSAAVDADDEFVPVVLALDPKELSSTPSEHCAEEISPVVLVDEPGLDSAVDTTVSEVVAPETESTAAGTSEGADTQAPSVSLEDEGYKADASVLEATATNPAIPPSIQKEESNGPADATPRDEPDPSSVLEPTAALMPEQASLVEDADTQSAETSPTDESGHDLAAPADAPAAGQMNDYSQGEDDFDEDVSEPEPKSTNVDVVAEIPMEPAVNATNDESQYDDDDADADFDGDEDTTITSNEIPAKDAPIVQPEENDVSTVKDTTTPEHTTMEEYATYLPTSTWENGTGTLGDETPANEIDNKALVIENPEPNTTPESVAVTPEPSPSTNAYEEDFPVDDAPPITNGQLDTTKAVDPANNTLGEVEQAVSSAAKAEDMPPETNPSAAVYEEDFPPGDSSPETAGQITMDAPAVGVEGASVDFVSADDEGSGVLVNSDSEPHVPDVSNDDSTKASSSKDTMSRSPSREEFNDEGFEDDKPTPDVVDEYEEFENDEDPEEEKLVETKANAIPPTVSVSQSSTPSEPPASAREEDIEEEAEEEAYADDQDYNEFEEEDTPALTSGKTTPREAATASEIKQDKPTPHPVEVSEGEGDDYEDEEEYAEDEGEFEENSPHTKPTIAPVQSVLTTNKSDVDEIDDEVGYDSEYNESDD